MSPVDLRYEHDGQVARLVLDRPKANILDTEMIEALGRALTEMRDEPALKAVVVEGAGKHFSFGASVEEHQAEPARRMIPAFGRLFRQIMELAVPTVALVRGQCLGGGMELAAFCNWVFATPEARFGQPEIQLAVFAPVASLILPWLVGQAHADEICLSGRAFTAEEAHAMGLVHTVSESPEEAVQAFVTEHLLPRSASALQLACRASRRGMYTAFREGWPDMERLYLDEVMSTVDANEGIAAFLEKRPARWANA